MSRYHENVTWQSPDGTWSRGFYPEDYLSCDDDCDDETHEWCREFDHSRFYWVSVGHPTEEAAARSWDGANPGTTTVYPYDPTNPARVADVAAYDDMAAVLYEEEQSYREKRKAEAWSRGRSYWGSMDHSNYHGPARIRSLAAMARERNGYLEDFAAHRLGGYDNLIDPRHEAVNKRISERFASATPAEVEAFEAEQTAYRDRLRARLDQSREERRRRAAADSRYPYRGDYQARAARSRMLDEREAEVEAMIAKSEAAAANRAAKRNAVQKPVPVKKATPSDRATRPQARGKTTAKSNQTSFKTFERPKATASGPVHGLGAGQPMDAAAILGFGEED